MKNSFLEENLFLSAISVICKLISMQCAIKYTPVKPNYHLVFTYMPLFKLFVKCASIFFLLLFYTTAKVDKMEYFFFVLLFILVCDLFEKHLMVSMLDHTQICLDIYLSLLYWDFCSGIGFWSSFVMGLFWFACYVADVLIFPRYFKPVQLKILIPILIIVAQYGWWSVVLKRRVEHTFVEMQYSRVVSCMLYSILVSLDAYLIRPVQIARNEKDMVLPDHSKEHIFWHGYVLFMEHYVSLILALLDFGVLIFRLQYTGMERHGDDDECSKTDDPCIREDIIIDKNIASVLATQRQDAPLNMSGLIMNAPLEKVPTFQKVNTKTFCSSDDFEKALRECRKVATDEDDLDEDCV